MFVKENPDKKKKEANSRLQHLGTGFRSMMGEECFHDRGPYQIETSPLICCSAKSVDWVQYDRDLRHERVNAFLIMTK